MEYYSALKRNKILIHAIAWINHENSMLREINQTQKDKYCIIHLYEVLRKIQFIETVSRVVIIRVIRGWRE